MAASRFAARRRAFGDGFARIVRRVEQVARAAPRVYEWRREAVVNLAAQAGGIFGAEGRERGGGFLPDVRRGRPAGEHWPPPPRPVFHRRVPPWRAIAP